MSEEVKEQEGAMVYLDKVFDITYRLLVGVDENGDPVPINAETVSDIIKEVLKKADRAAAIINGARTRGFGDGVDLAIVDEYEQAMAAMTAPKKVTKKAVKKSVKEVKTWG